MHIIALDFSKAFDTVRHSTLAQKLANFSLPVSVFNWFIDYLTDRQHCTRVGGVVSPPAVINSSIVQGSGIGPTAYVLDASDLHPISPGSSFCKYADDTYI